MQIASKYFLTLILFFSASLFSELSSAYGGWRERNFSFDTYHSSYNNISVETNVGSLNLPRSLDFDFGYRTFKIFSLHLNYSHFFSAENTGQIQSKISQYGFGFKVDLPGFFFLGAESGDMLSNSKNYPVCTSAFIDLIRTSTTMNGLKQNGFSHRVGLVTDFFLFNEIVYLSLRGGGITFLGDTYTFYSIGLGGVF
jgi:hypothetical protein